MKTINDYTIYCTEEQTKRALELGAPIVLSEKREIYNDYPQEIPGKIGKYFTFEESYSCCFCNDYGAYIIPTAEQLINWLRKEKGFKFLLSDASDSIDDDNWWWLGINGKLIASGNDEAKELAAIDAALEYLSNNLMKKL